MAAQNCNLSTWEDEIGESQVQSQPGIHSKAIS
jgi:hypothetical protein